MGYSETKREIERLKEEKRSAIARKRQLERELSEIRHARYREPVIGETLIPTEIAQVERRISHLQDEIDRLYRR